MMKVVEVSAFFISFGAIFFSFCVIFHILLPNSPAFGSFGNAIIKVLAMLMGELDFTANFVTNEDSGVVSKTFFVPTENKISLRNTHLTRAHVGLQIFG